MLLDFVMLELRSVEFNRHLIWLMLAWLQKLRHVGLDLVLLTDKFGFILEMVSKNVEYLA